MVCTHAPPGCVAGRVQGAVKEGGVVLTCFFGVPPQFFPRGWARGNGLKGAILNGISGQGAEMYRLWEGFYFHCRGTTFLSRQAVQERTQALQGLQDQAGLRPRRSPCTRTSLPLHQGRDS